MFVKLTSCKNAFEAEVVKNALADMGIEAILQGENISTIYGGIDAFAVNVLVEEKDYEKALTFIDSREPEPSPEPVPQKAPTTWKHKLYFSATFALFLTISNLIVDIIRHCVDTPLTYVGTAGLAFSIMLFLYWAESKIIK